MGGYLSAMWRCRFFWLSMVKTDLRSRHHGSTLGMGWSVLQPLAMSVIICAAFHNIFMLPITYFGPFLMVGLALWNFIVNSTLQGCQCFRSAEAYIRQYPAPLAIYPLRTTLGLTFQFLVALAVAILLAAVLHGLPNPLVLLSLVPSLALILVLGWALAVLGGLANVHFPDTSHLAEVGFQGLFFLSPVMFAKDQVAYNDPLVSTLFRYNPLVFFFRLLREPIMEGHVPAPETYAAAALIVLVLTLLAAYLLRRLEPRLIYHL